jgi:hypothetical protein
MRIDGTTYEPLRPNRPVTGPGRDRPLGDKGEARATEEGRSGASSAASDQVQFSDVGRRLSAAQADSIDPDRVKELRERVMSGAYNSLEMVEQVARRILDSGDV